MTTPPLHHLFHPANTASYVDTMRLGIDELAQALRAVTAPATGQPPEAAEGPVREVDLDAPWPTRRRPRRGQRLYLDDAV